MPANATIKHFIEFAGIWQIGALGDFDLGYNTGVGAAARAKFDQLVPTVPSNSPIVRLAGVKDMGELIPYRGAMEYEGLDYFNVSVEGTTWGKGFAIGFREWKADGLNLAKLRNLPAFLVDLSIRVRFKLFVDMLTANTALCEDGEVIFSNSHPTGDNTMDYNVATTTAPTVEELGGLYDALATRFATFTKPKSSAFPLVEHFNPGNIKLVCPAAWSPSLRRLQKQIWMPKVFGSNTAAASADNIDQGVFDALQTPRLSSTKAYAIYCDESDGMLGTPAGAAPAFVRTEFRSPELRVSGPDDPCVRNNDRIENAVIQEEGVGPFAAATRAIEITLT